MDIGKVLESSYVQLCIIFILAVLLHEIDYIQSYDLNFKLFAYLLPLFGIPALMGVKKSNGVNVPYYAVLLAIFFLLALILRFVPYTHTNIPLGYDPGFYKYTIELYQHSLPTIPEGTLPDWVKFMYPQGLFVLTDTLYIFTGLNALEMLQYFFPFLCALLVLPVFILTRQMFDERTALIASALYAVSYTQYTAFTFLYFKNIIGLIFLLLAMYLLEQKKYVPLTLMYAAMGIYHRPEFLLFSLILIPYFAISRDRHLVYMTCFTALLIAPFWLPRLEFNLPVLAGVYSTALTNIQADQAVGGGTFFGFDMYQWVALAYLPFGLMGVIYLSLQKRWNTLFFGFLINAMIVVFQLFFFKRFIISLDLLLIILAGAGLNYGFLRSDMVHRHLGTAAVILLVISSGVVMAHQSLDTRPLINDNQLEAIVWLSRNAEPDAYILATSYDAPWVLGWSERRVIAPGLFQWNVYEKAEWVEFLRTTDSEVAKKFLRPYSNNTIYIYHSNNRLNKIELSKFEDVSFEKIERDGVNIYKYKSNAIPQ
jgi:hypothetical protein